MHGILVVDKPAGLSSAATVDKVKRAVRAGRAGHGGTLDPIATGVLPVCLGAATKLAQYLLADDKAYEADGILGIETDTLDRTGTITAERTATITRDHILEVLSRRLGPQDQLPPMYSAIKQGGVRLYERARAGEDVERVPRAIRIDRLELIAFEPPRFRLAIECSKGTYVRSVVADVGTELGCGAHLTELRRTRSGRFSLAQGLTLDQITSIDVRPHLIPMAQATTLPSVVIAPELFSKVRAGLQMPVDALTNDPPERFQLVDVAGRLHAIVRAEHGRLVYDRVFHEVDILSG